GKRHTVIQQYGYSPKNFVQLLRLTYAGTEFFSKGIFPVDLKLYNLEMAKRLVDIKTNPDKYKKEDLLEESYKAEEKLEEAYVNRVHNFKYNKDLANTILEAMYMKELN